MAVPFTIPIVDELPATLTPSMVPHEDTVTFHDSTYFARFFKRPLPRPSRVRRDWISSHKGARSCAEEGHLAYPRLDLFVKFGIFRTSVAEGQCLYALGRLLKGKVPVPEVFGWTRDGKQCFLYMKLIRGRTLQEGWPYLSDDDKDSILGELHRMRADIHSLKQDPLDTFIGSIGRQPLRDGVFCPGMRIPGPFESVPAFHDFFYHPPGYPPDDVLNQGRRDIAPDNAPITFIHGDLHPGNIMISLKGKPRVLAIIDWQDAGWMPAYWEYCKSACNYKVKAWPEVVSRVIEPCSQELLIAWNITSRCY